MAGTFGLTRENFAESMLIGQDLIETMCSSEHQLGMTECSGCRQQMEQRSAIPTLHPLKILALAYGLMPQVRRRLKPNPRSRLTLP
jgi:Fe-S oxidoreductase